VNHRRTTRAGRESNLEGSSVRTAFRQHRVREEIGVVDRKRVHAEEIDVASEIVRTKRTVIDVFLARARHDWMHCVMAADRACDQARPIDCHGVGRLSGDDPKWRLIG